MTREMNAKILKESAALLLEDRQALPGPADVRREIRAVVAAHAEIPAAERDRAAWEVWDLAERPWLRHGGGEFATVAGWAQWLRLVAERGDGS